MIKPSFFLFLKCYTAIVQSYGRTERRRLFFMGILRDKLLHAKEQFRVVDDQKLQLTLASLADKYSYDVREMIRRAYDDPELASIYRGWRNIHAFDKGGKHRIELFRFPNGHVFDFVDTVLTALYGPDWLQNKKAWKHELIRPWWIREKI